MSNRAKIEAIRNDREKSLDYLFKILKDVATQLGDGKEDEFDL